MRILEKPQEIEKSCHTHLNWLSCEGGARWRKALIAGTTIYLRVGRGFELETCLPAAVISAIQRALNSTFPRGR